MMPYRIPSFWTEARMLCRKTGNKTMNRSEESIMLMTPYRFPHHGNRSFTFVQDDALPSVITQNGGKKRIFILFFCVIPPSQYPPSGFAGHLLINKEAYPIPILPVRIPFLNTVANPLLALWMTPYRLRSFWTEARMLCRKDGKRNDEPEWRIYDSDDILPSSSLRQQILHIRLGWWLTFPSLQQQIFCCCFVWHLTEIICFGF